MNKIFFRSIGTFSNTVMLILTQIFSFKFLTLNFLFRFVIWPFIWIQNNFECELLFSLEHFERFVPRTIVTSSEPVYFKQVHRCEKHKFTIGSLQEQGQFINISLGIKDEPSRMEQPSLVQNTCIILSQILFEERNNLSCRMAPLPSDPWVGPKV